MNLLRLYYITGIVLILLTIILSTLGMLSVENIQVFALAGILLLILGIIQHFLLMEKSAPLCLLPIIIANCATFREAIENVV